MPGAGGPSHAVMIEAQKAVKKGGSGQKRALVGTELAKTSKTLTEVADHAQLKILDAGGAASPDTAKIRKIVKQLSPAQRDLVRTAVSDAIAVDRDVVYNCGVSNLGSVTAVHFHIHVDSEKTTIEICPDLHI